MFTYSLALSSTAIALVMMASSGFAAVVSVPTTSGGTRKNDQRFGNASVSTSAFTAALIAISYSDSMPRTSVWANCAAPAGRSLPSIVFLSVTAGICQSAAHVGASARAAIGLLRNARSIGKTGDLVNEVEAALPSGLRS